MRNLFPLVLLAFSAAVPAATVSLTESLLQCDSRFFHQLKQQQALLKNSAPLQQNKDVAWFSPAKADVDITWFTQPVLQQNVKIIGYFERYNDLKELGKYYYWGFVIDGQAASVAAAMPQAGWTKAGDDYIANAQILLPGSLEWKGNNTAVSGIAPDKDSAEKLAILSDVEGKSHMLCTVQGKVTREILSSLRPDLTGKKS